MSRYQLLPPLSDAEYAALREDIRAAGVRVPIDVDEDGNILDGHHRKKIADELGVECPERVVRDLPEFAKVDYALTVNLTRRHLDKEGRKALVTRSLKRDPRLSDREHARRCGVSHTYVSGVREALEAAEQLATSASRVGKDGRERPVPADTKPAADRVDPAVASPEVPANSPGPAPAGATGAGSAPAPVADTEDAEGASSPVSSVPEPVNPPAGEGEQGGPATSPAGPPCEKCGAEILPGQANAGYTRCDPCDSEGDHQRDSDGECGRCKTHCPHCEQPLPT